MQDRSFAATIAVGIALFAAVAAGQDAPSARPPNQATRQSRGVDVPGPANAANNVAEGPVVSVEFKGGTLGDLVKTLQGQSKEPVNIALQGDAAAIPVEPMTLRNVTVYAALEAAIGARVNSAMFEADGTAKQITLGQMAGSGDGAPVFVITRRETEQRQMGRELGVQVFSIQKLVSGPGAMSPDVVLTVIDSGLGLQPRSNRPRPEIKLHKDSGLLLVRGDPSDVGLIDQIVSRLQKDHDRQAADQSRQRVIDIDRGVRRRKAESIIRESNAAIASIDEQTKVMDAGAQDPQVARQYFVQKQELTRNKSASVENRERAQADLDRIKAETDAGLGADGSPTDASGPDLANPSGDGVREERIRALEARIAALEAELAASKVQGGRQRPR